MKRSLSSTRAGMRSAPWSLRIGCGAGMRARPRASSRARRCSTNSRSSQAGTTATTVTADTPDCLAGHRGGEACRCRWGTRDGALPAGDRHELVQLLPGRDRRHGRWAAWDCAPFANVTAVIAVFDRLLDTAPLDPGDASGVTDVATTTGGAGAPAITLLTDYASTGAPTGSVFNLFGPFFGNFRADGPSLFSGRSPSFPSGTTVTVSLQADRSGQGRHDAVHGRRPAAGRASGVHDGAFTARVAAPRPTPMTCRRGDGGVHEPGRPTDVDGHITVDRQRRGAAADRRSAPSDGSAHVSPSTAGWRRWPAGAHRRRHRRRRPPPTVLGQTLGAAATGTFTAP